MISRCLGLNLRAIASLSCTVGLYLAIFFPQIGKAETPQEKLKGVGIETVLGAPVDLTARFLTEFGEDRSLEDLIPQGGVAIITPVYYHCPRLCGLLLNGVVELVNALDLQLGADYSIISFSFDPKEGPEQAAKMASSFRAKLAADRGVADPRSRGWHFLSGNKETINKLTAELGFKYVPDHDEFAHAPVFMIVSRGGVIMQFFAGVNFAPEDVRLALVEASQGKIGGMIDQVMLFCFNFDPTLGKYTWAAFRVMRIGGVLTLLFLGGLIYWSSRKKSKS